MYKIWIILALWNRDFVCFKNAKTNSYFQLLFPYNCPLFSEINYIQPSFVYESSRVGDIHDFLVFFIVKFYRYPVITVWPHRQHRRSRECDVVRDDWASFWANIIKDVCGWWANFFGEETEEFVLALMLLRFTPIYAVSTCVQIFKDSCWIFSLNWKIQLNANVRILQKLQKIMKKMRFSPSLGS